MSAQPTGAGPNSGTGEDAVKRQLEALVNGECDHVAFLDAMKQRFRFEPDENWEVLSLLDQYYRRGKISQDVFRAIKNGFAEYILGPQVPTPTLHTVAMPAPTPPAAAAPTLTPPPAGTGAATPATRSKGTKAPSAATSSHADAARDASAAPPREVRVGDVLRDRYRVEAVVARGGSCTIYEIIDSYRLNLPPSGKRLAAKVPRAADTRGNLLAQLRHEFQQLQHLSHPNIVRAFDLDRDGALSFFTMELLNGVHLPKILQSKGVGQLPRTHALAIIRDIGSAIAYAHSRGVVHGDVNPQNVFVAQGGDIRLLGFGAAHKLSIAMPMPDFERASAASDSLRYASCEVLEGNAASEGDDIYSLSCLAYLLLKGSHPYSDTTSVEARAKRLRPRRPAGLNYQQWRALRAGLSTDPAKRPASVQEWLQAMALSGAAEHLPAANEMIEAGANKPRRLQILAAAAVLIALIAVGVWYALSGKTPTLPPLARDSATEEQAAPAAPTDAAAPPTGAAPTGAAPAAIAPNAFRPNAVTPPASQPVAKPMTAQPIQRPAAAATPVKQASSAPTDSAARAGAPKAAAAATGAANSTAAPAAAVATAARASGNTRVEMAVDTLDALPTDTSVHVTVLRKGSLRGVTSFTWWTESGTAKPGIDFAPVLPHVSQMQDGESSTVLTVPLIPTVRAQPKGFYIGIESIEGGAQIGARALTQVTVPPTN